MKFLHNLKLWLKPPRIVDPDFGSLHFIHISKRPERSYWEGEWVFPGTDTVVAISLDGDENGPKPRTREFYLGLPARFTQILTLSRPQLQQVFQKWLHKPLPPDICSAVELSGFSLEESESNPVHWNISFETIDDPWLSVTIPFVGDQAMEAIVDT